MKQEIICPPCAVQQRDLFPVREPYPGEFVSVVDGTALANYICYLCSKKIIAGDECAAFSIWTKKAPYVDWERHFIKIKEVQP